MREAAAASIGYRLAAPALRARQRQSTSQAVLDFADPGWDTGPRAPDLGDTWQDRWQSSEEPAFSVSALLDQVRDLPWRSYVGWARRASVIGAMGAAGFAVVLYQALPRPAEKTRAAVRTSAMEVAQTGPVGGAGSASSSRPASATPADPAGAASASVASRTPGAAAPASPASADAGSSPAPSPARVAASASAAEDGTAPPDLGSALPGATPQPMQTAQPRPFETMAPDPGRSITAEAPPAPGTQASAAPPISSRPWGTEAITARQGATRMPRSAALQTPRTQPDAATAMAEDRAASHAAAPRRTQASAMRLATSFRPRMPAWPAAHHAAPAAFVHAQPPHAATRRAALARADLPRWLTQPRASKPATLVMSEPPHNLSAPPSLQHQAMAIEPNRVPGIVLPALRSPAYASAPPSVPAEMPHYSGVYYGGAVPPPVPTDPRG